MIKEGAEVLLIAKVVRQAMDTIERKGYVLRTERHGQIYANPEEIIIQQPLE